MKFFVRYAICSTVRNNFFMRQTNFARKFVPQMASQSLKAIVWLWALTLSASTVGVSVQQIYCYCVGQTTVGIFEAEDACSSRPEEDVCCKKSVRSCCSKPEKSTSGHGCTSKTTRVFQLKTEFTVEKKGDLLPAAPDLASVQAPSLPVFIPQVTKSGYPAFPPLTHSPPLSGRQMCIRYGVFRC